MIIKLDINDRAALAIKNNQKRVEIRANDNKYDFCLISTLKENSANDFYKKINGNFIGICKFNVMDNSYIENIYEFKI